MYELTVINPLVDVRANEARWLRVLDAFDRGSYRSKCVEYVPSATRLLSRLPSNAALLDAGCGTGLIMWHLRKRRLRRFGVDLLFSPTRAASAVCCAAVGDLITIPFRHSAFDAVLCGMVLMLIAKPQRVLRELRRVLRTGGTAFVAVLNDQHAALRRVEADAVNGAVSAWDFADDSGSIRVFFYARSVEWYELALRTAGFEDVRVYFVEPSGQLTTRPSHVSAVEYVWLVARRGGG